MPVPGCDCSVCSSENPRNWRTRSSLLIETGNEVYLVDSSTDLRFQLLREKVRRVDAVFYTHAHADHIHGIDDLRPLSRRQGIPLYGQKRVMEEIGSRFPYIFGETLQKGGGKPLLSLHPLEGRLELPGISLTCLPVWHGRIPIYGYRFNDFVYITDCSRIPGKTMTLIEGCRFMIIGGLRYRPHETHFSIDQAVGIIKKTGPERAWLTHICHDVDHDTLSRELPRGIAPAFDGLTINDKKLKT